MVLAELLVYMHWKFKVLYILKALVSLVVALPILIFKNVFQVKPYHSKIKVELQN